MLHTDVAKMFDLAADTYDSDDHHAVVADSLVAGVELPLALSLVVDVATGTGFAALAAVQRLTPQQVVAIDISAKMLDRARARSLDVTRAV